MAGIACGEVAAIDFGDVVRTARLGARMTQEQLAETSGISVRTIVELERGQVLRPRRDTIRRLADACGLVGSARERFETAARDRYWRERHTAPESAIPAQLPPDVLGFAGRQAELVHLDADLARATAEPTAVVIAALVGMAGVGKTALAVHWAHRVAGLFPDGQLYVNLRGFDPRAQPMASGEAVRLLLDALAVPARRIPPGLDARVGLYRSLLAGRRILVVLDNARDADQVRPLLPGSATTLVVVTSREDLSGLVAAEAARPLAVDVLSTKDARELLRNRLGPDRLAAEPDGVAEILTRCARLPLALAVVAARAATGTSLTLLAAELRDVRHRLDPLAGNDPITNVRAVFDCSYNALSPPAARLFRLAGLHPGPELTESAAASLAGDQLERVRPPLAELIGAHLLTTSGPGRFTFHDLVHAYAAERAIDDGADAEAARRRMLDHYLRAAHAADRWVIPARDPIELGHASPGLTQPSLVSRVDAVAWLTAERPVLIAAVRQAADAGLDEHAWQLAWATLEFFDRWGHWDDQATCHQIGLDAAVRLGDRGAQALTHRGLGRAYARLGRLDDARTHLEQAAELFGALGSSAGEARTHLSLSGLAERAGDFRRALHHGHLALTLFRAAGRPIGEGNALNTIGWCHSLLGEHDQAVTRCQESLALLEQTGDQYGQAGAWDSLGYARHHLAAYDEAITCYRRAIDLHRGNDDRHNEAAGLSRLGETYLAAGDAAAARDCWRQALDIYEQLDDPAGEEVRARLPTVDEDADVVHGEEDGRGRCAGNPGQRRRGPR
jgi:tetratricopeptide (TPR) repeat protein/transcriptional regulator with XRE-family HTH domain